MKAEIISIGDELLIGQVVNTNASWMANKLMMAGIQVVHISAIADDPDAITKALDQAAVRAELILLTGGLGPTKDDITKQVLADYFGGQIVFHEPTFEHIKSLFATRSFKLTEVNRRQAEIPDNCSILFNHNGTAPGMWFETDGKNFVSMPGVPFEMKPMLSNQLIPKLKEKFQLPFIYHKTIMTQGIGESWLAEKIVDWADALPENIKLAYLPQPGIVRLRLSATGTDKTRLEEEVNSCCLKLNAYIPEAIFGYDDISIEEVTGKLFLKSGQTLATAESCTGGYIAHLITSIAGCSDYFKGSIVSYSNQVKSKILGVPKGVLKEKGAVSQEVVEAMATGARQELKTDFALATSGIAGPDGGTDEKPVGTVWIALATSNGVQSRRFHFGEHRGRNIRKSALAALNMLRLELLASKSDLC